MESIGKRSFDEEWPALADGVQRAMVRRGIPSWLRDDIVQETGLRLLRMWDKVDHDRSPTGLAFAIARNVLWEEAHLRGGREILGVIPEQPDLYDVESAGIAREELGRVLSALPRLKETHRHVLLAEIGERPPLIGSRDAIKMLRMRARKRLTALMEQASASAGAVVMELRALGARSVDEVRKSGIAFDAQALAVTAGVVAITVTLVASFGDTRSQREDPGRETRTDLAPAGATRADAVGKWRPQYLTIPSVAHPSDSARATRRDDVRSTGPSQNKGAREIDRYGFSVGEGGPAEGEVSLNVMSREDGKRERSRRHPHCSATPENDGISASCSVGVQSKQVKAKMRVRVRPWDPVGQKGDHG